MLLPLPRRPRWSWPLSFTSGDQHPRDATHGARGSSCLAVSDGAVGEEAGARRGRRGSQAHLRPPAHQAAPASAPPLQGPPLPGGWGWGNASSRFGWGRSGASAAPAPPCSSLRGQRGSRTCTQEGRHRGDRRGRQRPSPTPRTRPGSWPLLARVTVASGLCARTAAEGWGRLRVEPGADGQATPSHARQEHGGLHAAPERLLSHSRALALRLPVLVSMSPFSVRKKRQCSETQEDFPQALITGSALGHALRPQSPGPTARLHPEGQAQPGSTHTPTLLGRFSPTAAGNACSVLHPHGTAPRSSTHSTRMAPAPRFSTRGTRMAPAPYPCTAHTSHTSQANPAASLLCGDPLQGWLLCVPAVATAGTQAPSRHTCTERQRGARAHTGFSSVFG